MWVLTTAPDYTTLVTLAAVKTRLKIDVTTDDTRLQALLTAAIVLCEQYTKRLFISQTWDYWTDRPGDGGENDPWFNGVQDLPMSILSSLSSAFVLDKVPLQAVTSIKYFDPSNVEATLSSAYYFVDTKSEPARVVLNSGYTWPTNVREANAFQLTCTLGYSSIANIPQGLIEAVIHQVYEMYDDPKQASLVPGAQVMLDPYRLVQL